MVAPVSDLFHFDHRLDFILMPLLGLGYFCLRTSLVIVGSVVIHTLAVNNDSFCPLASPLILLSYL